MYLTLRRAVSGLINSRMSTEEQNERHMENADYAFRYLMCKKGVDMCNSALEESVQPEAPVHEPVQEPELVLVAAD